MITIIYIVIRNYKIRCDVMVIHHRAFEYHGEERRVFRTQSRLGRIIKPKVTGASQSSTTRRLQSDGFKHCPQAREIDAERCGLDRSYTYTIQYT